MTEFAVKSESAPSLMARFAPRDERVIFVVIVGLIFAILVLPPLVFLVKGALTIEQGGVTRFTLERFTHILAQRGIWMSAFNSVVFAFGSALVALLIGGVNAWLVERTDTPFKALAYLTTIISLTPDGAREVLYTSSWLLLLARSGPINSWYRELTGETGVLINVYGLGGMIFIEGLLWSPLASCCVGSHLRNANPESRGSRAHERRHRGRRFARSPCGCRCRQSSRSPCWCSSAPSRRSKCRRWSVCRAACYVLTTDIYEHDASNHAAARSSVRRAHCRCCCSGSSLVLLYYYGPPDAQRGDASQRSPARFSAPSDTARRLSSACGAILVLNFLMLLIAADGHSVWAGALALLPDVSRASAFKLLSFDHFFRILIARAISRCSAIR